MGITFILRPCNNYIYVERLVNSIIKQNKAEWQIIVKDDSEFFDMLEADMEQQIMGKITRLSCVNLSEYFKVAVEQAKYEYILIASVDSVYSAKLVESITDEDLTIINGMDISSEQGVLFSQEDSALLKIAMLDKPLDLCVVKKERLLADIGMDYDFSALADKIIFLSLLGKCKNKKIMDYVYLYSEKISEGDYPCEEILLHKDGISDIATEVEDVDIKLYIINTFVLPLYQTLCKGRLTESSVESYTYFSMLKNLISGLCTEQFYKKYIDECLGIDSDFITKLQYCSFIKCINNIMNCHKKEENFNKSISGISKEIKAIKKQIEIISKLVDESKKAQKQITGISKEITDNNKEIKKLRSTLDMMNKYVQEQNDSVESQIFMENFYLLSEAISALYTLEKKKCVD